MGDNTRADNGENINKEVVIQDVREKENDTEAVKPDGASIYSESSSVQAGVQKALILRAAWSKTTLLIAFSRWAKYNYLSCIAF